MANEMTMVQPEELHEAANESKVYRTNTCYCGWYFFYGLCGHLADRHPLKCGSKRTRSGQSGFCTIPAPQYNVAGYQVNAYCNQCIGQ
ncbi:hypothetical protein GGS24DRAFT_485785 [Hypoxylon argillaceum]|nr:hypothetical protein GGS24DRAFT_485785 [Hypoxylon argillaceum]